MAVSSKPKMNVILLCCLGFIGLGGIHRFYVGRPLSGLLWLCTGGLCGIGTVYDLIMIGTDRFLDADGNVIKVQ
jgi:TM2 domain-containing membrane protein YozV